VSNRCTSFRRAFRYRLSGAVEASEELALIEAGEIRAMGFRYVGERGTTRPSG